MSPADATADAFHDRLVDQFRTLLEILLAEREALVATSADRLQDLVSRKEALCTDIARNQNTLLEALKPAVTLPDSMGELRDLARRCRTENALNGRIANRARRRTRTLLSILTGEDSAELYRPGSVDAAAGKVPALPGHRLGTA